MINSFKYIYEKIRCAESTGARCVGIEVDQERCEQAQININSSSVSSRCQIICGNALEYDYSNGTAFFLYLVPRGLKLILPLIRSQCISNFRIVTYMSPLPNETPAQMCKVSTAHQPGAEWPLFLYHFNCNSQND